MKSRDRRALIAGAVVALVAILVTRVLPMVWRSAGQGREELRIRSELLARSRSEVSGARALEDSGAGIRARLVALAPRLLAGNGAAEAMASLTQRVTSLAAGQRVRLERTTPLDDSTGAGGLRRISLRVGVTGDTRGTLDYLTRLAAGPIVLSAEDIRIVASNAGASDDTAEELQTELTVRGWYQPRERRR